MVKERDANANCWKRRTQIEKCLILSIGILLCALLAIIILLIITVGGETNNKTCLTPDCVNVAAEILKRADFSVDPCDDFYKFTCGNFEKKFILPEHKNSLYLLSLLQDEVSHQLQFLIEQPINANDIRPFIMAKHLYQACMDRSQAETRSLPVLQQYWKQLGGWPVVEGNSWKEEEFDWEQTIYKFMMLGIDPNIFFNIDVGPDKRNASRNILGLSQPITVSFQQIMINGWNESVVQAYFKYMVDVAVHFGANQEQAEAQLREVVDFEIALNKILVPPEEQRDETKTLNIMTIADLHKKYRYVDWYTYINTMIQPTARVTRTQEINVAVPDFFSRLGPFLSSNPKKTIANYIFWKITKDKISALTDELRAIDDEFIRVSTGTIKREPRTEECISNLEALPILMGSMFVRNFFDKNSKELVNEIVTNIKNSFTEMLTNSEWMDEITKQKALEKANKMRRTIAYVDELLDDNKLIQYYKNLTFDPNKFIESIFVFQNFVNHQIYKKLNEANVRTDWRDHSNAAEANAFYDVYANSIELPAAILQNLFFNHNQPQYINYGAIGYIIGHEIVHGFDDEGRQFDSDGNVLDWWEPSSKKIFNEKAQCIIEQYSNITVPGTNLQINGINTQGENIADNVGVKSSFHGYKKWAEKNGPELQLPGVPYTPEQLFWVSVGVQWCAIYRKESLKNEVLENFHAPAFYRVNVPLMNSKEFAETFSCPEGSPMNPTKKCIIW